MKLREYQKQAISFIKQKKKVYLAIDMGLGKTAITLHLIEELRLKALIIAPLGAALTTWPEEIKNWELDLSYSVLHGKNKRLDLEKQLQIINYEGLKWLYYELEKYYKIHFKLPFDCLILDEATFVKDPKTTRFKILKAICEGFRYVVCMSGTPSPNSLMDLWAQYYLLSGGEILGNDYFDFQRKYWKQDRFRKYAWSIYLGAEDVIHKQIAPVTFRLQSSDYINLPKRVFIRLSLELPTEVRKAYNSFSKTFILNLATTTVETFNQATLSSKLRQVLQGFVYDDPDECGRQRGIFIHSIKTIALKNFISENPDKNILCCIQFKYEQKSLAKEFPKARFITGQNDAKEKAQALKDWNKGKIKLLFVHPRSVGHGVNLQYGGSIIIWYALTYSLEDYLQLNKRLHRSGQKNIVKIYHLIIKNSLDEHIYSVLQSKDVTQRRLLDELKDYTKRYLAQTNDESC